MQMGHAARKYSKDVQYGHAALTCSSVNIRHRHGAWTYNMTKDKKGSLLVSVRYSTSEPLIPPPPIIAATLIMCRFEEYNLLTLQ
jgi:hypothetical protein